MVLEFIRTYILWLQYYLEHHKQNKTNKSDTHFTTEAYPNKYFALCNKGDTTISYSHIVLPMGQIWQRSDKSASKIGHFISTTPANTVIIPILW